MIDQYRRFIVAPVWAMTCVTLMFINALWAQSFVSDDFSGGLNGALWTVNDNVGDASIYVAGSELRIGVPAGVDHNAWTSGNRAARVLQAVANNDFQFEAKFMSSLSSRYQMQGLIVEESEGNYIQFRIYSDSRRVRLLVTATSNGSPSTQLKTVIPDSAEYYLRVNRQADQWTLEYSLDGAAWVNGVVFSHAMTVNEAGVFAGNASGSKSPAFEAVIDYVFNSASPIEPEDGGITFGSLMATTVGQGSVTRDPDQFQYTVGTVVTLAAIPEPGWEFAGWSGALGGTNTPVQFTVASNHIATATFTELPPTNGTVSVSVVGSGVVAKNPDQAQYALGSVVELTALPNAGWEFGGWSGAVSGTNNPVNVTVNGDEAVTATFSSPPSTMVSDDFSGGWDSNLWVKVDPVGDGVVDEVANVLRLAVPAGVDHNPWTGGNRALRVMQAVNNVDCQVEVGFLSAPQAQFQMQGLMVEEDADDYLQFRLYHDGSSVRVFAASFVNGTPTTQLNEAIGASDEYGLRATRQGNQWTLEYSLDGVAWQAGVTFSQVMTVNEVGVFAGNASGSTSPAFTALVDYVFNMDSPIAPEDGGVELGTLTVASVGSGTVTRDPDQPEYVVGSLVELTAVPQAGWVFANWSGTVSGTNNPVDAVIGGFDQVTAVFELPPTNGTVSVSVVGSGVVTKNPDQAQYTLGSVVELTALPDAGWEFGGWSGAVSGTGNPVNVTVNEDETVTATFNSPPSTMLSDDFSGGWDSNLWVKVDPVGDGVVDEVANVLRLAVPAGVDHNPWTGGNRALRVMQAVNNVDCQVEVGFLSAPQAQFQMQGLMVEEDADDYLQFRLYHDGSSVRVFAASFVNGTPTTQLNEAIGASDEYGLRATRQGNQWTLEYSLDGVAWQAGVTFSQVMTVNEVGVFAGNASGSTSPAFTALVDYVFNMDSPIAPEDGGVELGTLTVTAVGSGTVTRDPDQPEYVVGSSVELTAVPDTGWAFVGWSGVVSGTSNPVNAVIDGFDQVTALFEEVVLEAPQMTVQPLDLTVIEPTAAVFSAAASGSPPLSFQWRRGGVVISGATNSTYALYPTSQAGDDGAQFDVVVANTLGSVTSQVATLTVTLPVTIPDDGLGVWLQADGGVATNGSGVSQWTDQSTNAVHAQQIVLGSQPQWVDGVLNGLPVVRFDGIDDYMTFTLPVNGLTGMTLFLVAANADNQDGGGSQAERAALFWNETASWGTVYLSPFQSAVNLRFGTTQSGNRIVYSRPASVGTDFSLNTAVKDGDTDSIYVNRQLAVTEGGKLTTIAGCTDIGNLGRGFNDNTYYSGDLAEVLVYTRALSEAERQTVEQYLDDKYGLTSPTPPQIISQPANLTVEEPLPAVFMVSASGSSPLSYQWRRDGDLVPGATASSIAVNPSSYDADNGAQFDVVVSNAVGVVTSQVATLTVSLPVLDPPLITAQPDDLTVEEPAAATFSVIATGTLPLSYQWRRDGVPLPGATDASYVLDPTMESVDNGAQFDVVVTNVVGAVTSLVATLTVTTPSPDPPQIVSPPANLTVVEPSPASFSVVATGTPPLSYQWRRDGIFVPGATVSSYTLDPTSQESDDGAQFDVVVSNSEGSVTSQMATLTVNAPGSIPQDGLSLWFRADTGPVVNGSAVSQWNDQSGNNRNAAQSLPSSRPTWVDGVVNGWPVVRFDGVDDYLTFTMPVNGLSGMTIFVVAANTQDQDGGGSQAEKTILFWNETEFWGALYLSSFQSAVNLRFGTTQSGNRIVYTRPTSVGTSFTLTTALKSGAFDSIYVNRELAMREFGKLPALAGCQDTGNVGRGYNDNTYYAGDIAEVLIYEQALSAQERYLVEQYLDDKYSVIPASSPQITSLPQTRAGATFAYTYDVESTGNAPPTYSLIQNPSGMSIEPVSGVISWVPTAAQTGSHAVQIQAANASGIDMQTFTVEVLSCPTGIVSYWDLNEVGGNEFQDSVGVNEAFCLPPDCPLPASAMVGDGQVFDGNATRVSAQAHPSVDFGNSDSFTLSVWVRTETFGQTAYLGRFDQLNWMEFSIGQESDARPWFYLRDTLNGTISSLKAPLPAPPLGEWHHVVGVRDAGQNMAFLYVDGELVNSVSTLGVFTGTFSSPRASLDIGWLNLGSGFDFGGTLDEVAIFGRALSGAEVMENYLKGLAGEPLCSQ